MKAPHCYKRVSAHLFIIRFWMNNTSASDSSWRAITKSIVFVFKSLFCWYDPAVFLISADLCLCSCLTFAYLRNDSVIYYITAPLRIGDVRVTNHEIIRDLGIPFVTFRNETANAVNIIWWKLYKIISIGTCCWNWKFIRKRFQNIVQQIPSWFTESQTMIPLIDKPLEYGNNN